MCRTIETIQYPDLIQFTPPTSPILSPVPRRLGSPLPIELVLKIIDHLKNGQQYATLARLAQANSTYHRLAISKIYETITIDETNMLELDYGYNDCDLGLKITIVPTSGDNDDTQTPVQSAFEGPAESKKTPRHPAEEHCFRLIIDFPLANIAHSLDRVFGTLSSRFLNLQEIVYTTRALTDRDLVRHIGLPPSSLWASDRSPAVNNTADTSQSTEKTKRIILHLQSSPLCSVDAVLFYLTSWFQSRPTARKSTQFVVYGLNFAGPNYDFYCMDVECHFDQNGIPPGAFEHALAQWLYSLFSNGKSENHPRLRLFDIPSLVF